MLILGLLLLFGGVMLSLHILGVALWLVYWIFIKMPLALLFLLLAVACFCSIILIPLGLFFLGVAQKVAF